MANTCVSIGDGRWFNPTKAEKWNENTYFDGHNQISMATGSQWEHETLYRTSKGAWWLHHESAWQGKAEEWRELTVEEAVAWLHAQTWRAAAERFAPGSTAAREV